MLSDHYNACSRRCGVHIAPSRSVASKSKAKLLVPPQGMFAEEYEVATLRPKNAPPEHFSRISALRLLWCLLSQVRNIIAPSRSVAKRILVVSLALRAKNSPLGCFCHATACDRPFESRIIFTPINKKEHSLVLSDYCGACSRRCAISLRLVGPTRS